MKLPLDDLHVKKLREDRQRTQALLTQWKQAIQQIQVAEKRAGCPLLPKDVSIETPVEMAKQLPQANYLAVVETRNRAAERFGETVKHAKANLEHEIRRREAADNDAKSAIVSICAEAKEAPVRAESQCASNAKLNGCFIKGISALVSWIGLVYAFTAALYGAEVRLGNVPFWVILCSIGWLASLLFGWAVGLGFAEGRLIPWLERFLAKSDFTRAERAISREFDFRLTKQSVVSDECTSRLKSAQDAAVIL